MTGARVNVLALKAFRWPVRVKVGGVCPGRPLVTSLNDIIELHTTLPGYEARARFRLADFELPSVEALRGGPPDATR